MTYIQMTPCGEHVFLATEVFVSVRQSIPYEKIENAFGGNIFCEIYNPIGYWLHCPGDVMDGYVVTAEALDKKSVRIGEL